MNTTLSDTNPKLAQMKKRMADALVALTGAAKVESQSASGKNSTGSKPKGKGDEKLEQNLAGESNFEPGRSLTPANSAKENAQSSNKTGRDNAAKQG